MVPGPLGEFLSAFGAFVIPVALFALGLVGYLVLYRLGGAHLNGDDPDGADAPDDAAGGAADGDADPDRRDR